MNPPTEPPKEERSKQLHCINKPKRGPRNRMKRQLNGRELFLKLCPESWLKGR